MRVHWPQILFRPAGKVTGGGHVLSGLVAQQELPHRSSASLGSGQVACTG
ncbi:hypothetical protein [Paeniglutamicibacter gangotriensis]|nr:hypothetical protein [Paeniglutamicibacter gangotriensis]